MSKASELRTVIQEACNPGGEVVCVPYERVLLLQAVALLEEHEQAIAALKERVQYLEFESEKIRR